MKTVVKSIDIIISTLALVFFLFASFIMIEAYLFGACIALDGNVHCVKFLDEKAKM